MIPDIGFVREAFRSYNARIFGGELPEPRFAVTAARTFRGKLVYRRRRRGLKMENHDFELRISRLFDLPEREWEDVVIHEMIHLHIAHKGIADTSPHGKVFRKLMADINSRHSRRITISARSEGGEDDSDSRIRGHYLCLGRLRDGRIAVAPVARTRVMELWSEMARIPGVEKVGWVGTTDPWFNRLPRVMKPKLYLVEEEELRLHLAGSLELVRSGNSVRAVSTRKSPDELLP